MDRMVWVAACALLLMAGGCGPQDAETEERTQPSVRAQGDEPARQSDADRTASATLVDRDGAEIGTAELVQTPNHGVLIRLEVEGLEPGTHGFHIHETGTCTTPDFTSAGGHFAPRDRSHGILHVDGMHGGDMPNLHVPSDGAITAERVAEHVSLVAGETGYLLDDDGSALMVHAGADDYQSQPSGDAGDRVACGVIG